MKPFISIATILVFYKKQSHPFPFPFDVLEKYLPAGSRTDMQTGCSRQAASLQCIYYVEVSTVFNALFLIFFLQISLQNPKHTSGTGEKPLYGLTQLSLHTLK